MSTNSKQDFSKRSCDDSIDKRKEGIRREVTAFDFDSGLDEHYSASELGIREDHVSYILFIHVLILLSEN